MATKMVWQHEVFFCDAYALGGKRDLQVQEKVLGLGKELNVDPVYSRTQIRMPQWLLSLLIPVALHMIFRESNPMLPCSAYKHQH